MNNSKNTVLGTDSIALESKLRLKLITKEFFKAINDKPFYYDFKEHAIHYYKYKNGELIQQFPMVGYPDFYHHDTEENIIYIVERKKLGEWKHAFGQLLAYKDAIESKYKHYPYITTIVCILQLICDESTAYVNGKLKTIESCSHKNNIKKLCKHYNITCKIYEYGPHKMLDWRLLVSKKSLIDALYKKDIIQEIQSSNISDDYIYILSQGLNLKDIDELELHNLLKSRNIKYMENEIYDEIIKRCENADYDDDNLVEICRYYGTMGNMSLDYLYHH